MADIVCAGTALRLLIAIVLVAALVWIAAEDLRRFVVRNGAVALLIACCAAEGLRRNDASFALWHGLIALGGLVVFVGAYALRWIGGGDAKLLAAALLWIGPEQCALFAAALFMCTVLYAAGAWCGVLPTRRAGQRTAMPFAPCICLAWIACLAAMLP